MKLITVKRSIGIFNIKTKKNVQDVELSVSVKQLEKIITANDDDKGLYYDFYILTEEQILLLNKYSQNTVVPNLSKYLYGLQCIGEYDWNNDN